MPAIGGRNYPEFLVIRPIFDLSNPLPQGEESRVAFAEKCQNSRQFGLPPTFEAKRPRSRVGLVPNMRNFKTRWARAENVHHQRAGAGTYFLQYPEFRGILDTLPPDRLSFTFPSFEDVR